MIRLAVDVRDTKTQKLKAMTDEQLATADELITETMAEARVNPDYTENGAALFIAVLDHQRSKVRDEAKLRMERARLLARGRSYHA